MIYSMHFELSDFESLHERTIYNMLDFLGDLGGVVDLLF